LMSFLAFGINHKTASVELREKVAFDLQKINDALISLLSIEKVSEGVILSTCNRTEIYCSGEESLDSADLLAWLESFHTIDRRSLESVTFTLKDERAIEHVMRVAAGLDSLVLGEPQILGQLKSAYASAIESKTVGGRLSRLLEASFSVAKQVRTDTAIGESAVSVAAASVAMARKLFGDLSGSSALLIGAGKTNELVARHLRQAGVQKLTVANRTMARAQELAGLVGAEAALLGEIPDLLVGADIVISSTASPLPILGKGAVERALKLRKHRPFFMVDIAVPRDIEPQVGDLSDVYLYTVDDLSDVIDENRRSREQAAKEAEKIIAGGVKRCIGDVRVSSSGEVLKKFRENAEALRLSELDKALRSIEQGADAQQTLKAFSRALTQKLIHEPTVRVREAAASGNAEQGQLLLNLFGLDHKD
jgi:glutamyl-tRNA reductase